MKPRDIKEMRARLGLTQRGLAETIGCTIYAICNYEQGQRHPADPFDMRIKKLIMMPLADTTGSRGFLFTRRNHGGEIGCEGQET